MPSTLYCFSCHPGSQRYPTLQMRKQAPQAEVMCQVRPVRGTDRGVEAGATPWAKGTRSMQLPATCTPESGRPLSPRQGHCCCSHLSPSKERPLKRASNFTLGHEAEEEQDAGRNPLGDPKRKDVDHFRLMTTIIYLHALGYSLPSGPQQCYWRLLPRCCAQY